MSTAPTLPVTSSPSLLVGSRRIPVVLPSRRDPRLRLSIVIIALQILGQTSLGFKLSIAQILVSVAVAAAIETAVTWHRVRMLVWPASAFLTGNSVAFILRATGTRHGDWWSLHGIQFFILAVVLSLLSKYLIRIDGRHVFNPSNVGLVWVLLVIGPAHVFPQYLWWGPLGTALTLALIVIVAGAVWVLRSVRMMAMAAAFLLVFAALVGIFAAAGQTFVAIWHAGPISGSAYWRYICLSPEVLVFVFFMMSDPKTAPRSRTGQIAFGAGTAAVAALLLLFQPTEYGVKVAILASLTVTTALARLPRHQRRSGHLFDDALRGLRVPAAAAAVVIAVAAPIDTLALARDRQITYLEQGFTGTHNPQ